MKIENPKYEFYTAFSNLIEDSKQCLLSIEKEFTDERLAEFVANEIDNAISEASMNGREDADEDEKVKRFNTFTMQDTIKYYAENFI